MTTLPRSPKKLRPAADFQPSYQSIVGDIQAAVHVIDAVTKRLGSLRSGLKAIETKALSVSGECIPLSEARGPNWITRREAAAIASVDPTTINIWVRACIIPRNALLPIGKKRFRYSRAWFEMHRTLSDEQPKTGNQTVT